ncbi:putative pectinesterase/pectinesterase inhibitor 22 [Dendrobium catenatum]|uniref:putative pectinesterase/pectinesterase inhibitor 22 n=1 Tax=Dendrobium catenatum TaxID=906689 RepID=UPI0010A0011C|nr:putative pectinesterase/pectinesterase inhibitor 22 [Dendrobium catenatum]
MAETTPTLILFLLLHLLLLPSLHSLPLQSQSLIHRACLATSDYASCTSRLRTQIHHPDPDQPDSTRILHAAAHLAINEALRSIQTITALSPLSTTLRERSAIEDCQDLLDLSVHQISQSLAEITLLNNAHHEANLRTWLSAALSNQDTCLEGFEGTDGRLRHYARAGLNEITQLVSNLFEVYKRLRSIIPRGNETKWVENAEVTGWITEEEMEMVRGDAREMVADAVVAADGTGRFRTVGEAVEEAPDHSLRRYVIFVKRGVYRENVELKRKKSNIMLVGEGMGVTVITGNRNFVQGWTTFRTATFAVSGPGFIARDITFRNTAGPQNHQAVALRVDSDRSAFFRCSIEGYQDTLYAHSLRQFYRDCHIHGTIDFIFGNGQAIFQNCKIFTRKPLSFQKVTITAQGRKDRKQNTGFSIHNSFVYATVPTYLGRPWKAFSRTVFMQSYLGPGVQPAGWLEWAGDFALNTLFYGEYMNFGPGSGLVGRVRWPGYHVIRDAAVAEYFTVRRFIDGAKWLPTTRIPFTADLID